MVPSRRFVLALALVLVPLALSLLWRPMAGVAVGLDALLLALLGLDLLRAPKPSALEASRECETVLSLRVPSTVRLELLWRGASRARVHLVDSPPAEATTTGHRATLGLEPGTATTFEYRLTPHRRGEHAFGDLYLRLEGPLGLALRTHRVPLSRVVRVYPDITTLIRNEAALVASARAHRRRGRRPPDQGRTFDRLREYVAGDEIRHVDWKATARRGEPVTREYRPEENQDVILMIDCGRQMRPRIGNETKLDLAVDTALTLAHVAMERGDRVGLVVFGDTVKTHLPPRRGRDQLMRIVDALYHVEPTLAEPDYHAAYDELSRRALRRALIVTFTDLADEDSSRVVLARTRLLRPRHLPLVVTVADTELLALAEAIPSGRAEAYRRIAAARVVRDQARSFHLLSRSGALFLNVPAAELSAATVGRYLSIKAQGRL